jgi:hypothetical protein
MKSPDYSVQENSATDDSTNDRNTEHTKNKESWTKGSSQNPLLPVSLENLDSYRWKTSYSVAFHTTLSAVKKTSSVSLNLSSCRAIRSIVASASSGLLPWPNSRYGAEVVMPL